MNPSIRPSPYVAIIIQAREKSDRLPGKVFRKIGKRSILEHVIARCKDAMEAHAVVVATPDKRIADISGNRGAFDYWHRDGEENVLDRYVKAAEFVNADIIVRVTADCPLIDPAVIDECILGLENNDFCSNVLRRRFPVGMDVEVFHRDTLYRMERMARHDAFWKEHVTYGVYTNQHLWLHNNIDAVKDYSWIKLAVDTEDDLNFVRSVYSSIEPGDGYREISERVSERFRAFVAAGGASFGSAAANGAAANRSKVNQAAGSV